jgi:hypothetical protein
MAEITTILEGSTLDDIFGVLVEDIQSILIDDDEKLEAFTGDCSIITTWGVIGLDRQPKEWLSSDNYFWDLSEESPRLSIWRRIEQGQSTIVFGNASASTRVYGGLFELGKCDPNLYESELLNAQQSLDGLYRSLGCEYTEKAPSPSPQPTPELTREDLGNNDSDESDLSLYERVENLIIKNEAVYKKNEALIQHFMMQRWRVAFVLTAETKYGAFNEKFPPLIPDVVDFGGSEIEDDDMFICDLQSVLTRLSNGEKFKPGEIGDSFEDVEWLEDWLEEHISVEVDPKEPTNSGKKLGEFKMKFVKKEYHQVTSIFTYELNDDELIEKFGSLERFKEVASHMNSSEFADDTRGPNPTEEEEENFNEFIGESDYERYDDWVTDRRGGYDITYEVQDEEN